MFSRLADDPEVFDGFEQRPQQVEMAVSVAEAFETGGSLLVEAGTGTGKSMAYLVPAACYALRNNARVVVSTSTISLQEQIVGKDVPALKRILARDGPADLQDSAGGLRADAVEGPRNYVCLQKFAALRDSHRTRGRGTLRRKLLLWLRVTRTGDRAELNLRNDEKGIRAEFPVDRNCFASGSCYVRDGTCQLLPRQEARGELAHRRGEPCPPALRYRQRWSGAAGLRPPGSRRGAQPGGRGDKQVRL